MKKIGLLVSILTVLAGIANAVAVNPASNVTADSANTALTIPYRDSTGAFSAGILTVTGLINSGTQSLQIATTAQIALMAVPAGTQILSESFISGVADASVYGLCVSTQNEAGDFIYLSTRTTTSIGKKCN